MAWLSMIGVATLAIVGLVAGVRLLVLARRSRALPEALVGVALSTMPLGFGLIVGGIALVPRSEPAGVALMCAGSMCLNLGGVAPAVFTYRVFRPKSRVALIATFAIFASAAFSWIGNGVAMGYRFDLAPGTFSGLAGLTRAVSLSWAGAESFLYWRAMRRRLRLGLTDGLVTNRFALWAVGTSLGSLSVVAGLISDLGESGAAANATVQILISLAGLGAAAAFLLAFMPPRAYRRWLERDASCPRPRDQAPTAKPSR